MEPINDYKAWFDELELEPSDYELTSALVHAIRTTVYTGKECDCGGFYIQIAKGVNNGWILSADGVVDKLHLRTHKQISGFIRHIEANLCEDMDAEIYESFRHAMDKE